MNKLVELSRLGQAVWYDYIKRSFIINGELEQLIKNGLRGITSNPTIFDKAISGSSDYDKEIESLLVKSHDIVAVYEQLAIKDIKLAASLMLKVYKETAGQDGYVSLEVNPKLAYKTDETIAEAKRLYAETGMMNLMIKVPATNEGIPAITELIASGISVNVTLIFDLDNYRNVAEAYIKGLELLKQRGGKVSSVSSVASFFVSRVDSSVDAELDKLGNTELKGKAAIANAKVSYRAFKEIFSTPRWKKLEAEGAKVQRVLWASTGTKNPEYSPTLYVDELIGNDTVNTIPPATLDEFIAKGKVSSTLDGGYEDADDILKNLFELGIDLKKITAQLQETGVKLFEDSFDSLLGSLGKKIVRIKDSASCTFNLGAFQEKADSFYERAVDNLVSERIFTHDFSVWSEKPDEITNRLGWLDSPKNSLESIKEITLFVDEIRSEGFKNVLLLGMGGSSLAPEVFSKVFGTKPGYLKLSVLDSTDPDMVTDALRNNPPESTLYIVSTKSGGTVETISFMKYFYTEAAKVLGKEKAARRFAAITDPGSGLQDMAKALNFRKIFLNDPNIGGRYSALSLFGMVPAALTGVDISKFLHRALISAEGCKIETGNSALKIGATIAALSTERKDKVTFICDDKISPFGAWVEQLIAESTGKIGKGILPVEGGEVYPAQDYSDDRVFVYMRLENSGNFDKKIKSIKDAGFPVIEIYLTDEYDLAYEFFRWEFATAVSGWALEIQPFDQPDVESAKIMARKFLQEYHKTGKLPVLEVKNRFNDITIEGFSYGDSLESTLKTFLELPNTSKFKRYLSIHAYLPMTTELEKELLKIRSKIEEKYKIVVTTGFGPRFLHSTGQLHKGDSGNGLFIQFTGGNKCDALIPDEALSENSSLSFGALKNAQSLGDREALINAGRKVLRINLGDSLVKSLIKVFEAV